MKNKMLKKMVGFGLAAVMTVSMGVSAFAGTTDANPKDTDGKVEVQFAIEQDGLAAQDPGKQDVPYGYTKNDKNKMCESEDFSIAIDSVKDCQATDVPADFAGKYPLEGTATAFNAIYEAATNENMMKMAVGTDLIYGFDTYSVPNGIYYTALSALATEQTGGETSTVPGQSSWEGYSWSFYEVPNGAEFDVSNPNEDYESKVYTSNMELKDDCSYYMIYRYNETTW